MNFVPLNSVLMSGHTYFLERGTGAATWCIVRELPNERFPLHSECIQRRFTSIGLLETYLVHIFSGTMSVGEVTIYIYIYICIYK